jgi:8-amino-7-oxononanoate synthase
LLSELETRLAAFKGTEAACVFGSGYLANMGIMSTFAGANDLVLMDELVHSSLWSGAKLSGAHVETFRHNDADHLDALLTHHRSQHPHCLVVTDGVFSMDGDLAPIGSLLAICNKHDAWLLVDDAHGIGVVNEGRGVAHGHDVALQMGTLSKALGSYGGYVCASATVIDYLKTRARTLVYSTALPPASVAAALAALNIVEHEPQRVAEPLRKAQLFTELMDLPKATSSIVPVIVGDSQRALALSQMLQTRGFLVGAIRPPTVPLGTSRLRVTFSAAHDDDDIRALASALRSCLTEMAS